MTETLKPCPFCGSATVECQYRQVKCFRCEAHGPQINDDTLKYSEQQEKACTEWNKAHRDKPTEKVPAKCPWCELAVTDDSWRQLKTKGSRSRDHLFEYWHRECRLEYEHSRPRGLFIRLLKWMFA